MSATPGQIPTDMTMSDVPSPPYHEDMADYEVEWDIKFQEDQDSGKPHRASPEPSSDLKQRSLDEQVSFIIRTRNNNTPDLYGKQSSAYGPLPWPAVADAYNQKFRVGQPSVGSAAMEKRARQRRDAWMDARPDYPRSIAYSARPKMPVSKRPRVPKAKPVRPVAQPLPTQPPVAQSAKSRAQEIELKTIKKKYKELIVRAAMTFEEDSRAFRVSGWVPPEEHRNADMIISFHCVEHIRDSEEHELDALGAFDTSEDEDDTMEDLDAQDENDVIEISDTDEDSDSE
jgi:hypothetical protein